MQHKMSEHLGDGRPQFLFGPFVGRLAPLALDNAQRKLDPTLLTLTLGGLSQEQIDGVDFVPSAFLERFRTAVRAMMFWLKRPDQ